MKRRSLFLFTLVVTTCLVATGFSPIPAERHNRWTQIPLEPQGNWGIVSMETFKGHLYAGTGDNVNGLAIWRLENDKTWKQVIEYGFGNPQQTVLQDMIPFRGKLYVGTGDWYGGNPISGQIWRSPDGTTWEPVTTDGFGTPNIRGFNMFAIFDDMLYVSTNGTPGELEIWRSASGAPGTWEQVITAEELGDAWAASTSGLIEFKHALYAVNDTDWGHPASVWRSEDGVTWSVVTEDGFGDPNNVSPGGVAILKDHLYVGMMNCNVAFPDHCTGQIWRTKDGWHYEKVIDNGFGDLFNIKVDSLYTFQGQLYAATLNFDFNNYAYTSGTQVFRSRDGFHWTQVNESGFGDPHNWVVHLAIGVTEYKGNLYYGTLNDFGGQTWKFSP
jgi:hypothetical protein